MARFGITSARTFGVSMATMQPLLRRLGSDQALAEALWASGWHEARIVAGLVAVPAACTPALMNRWVAAFDNWAVTDSTCLHLFSRAPQAWTRVGAWSRRRGEFQRRAAFALLAALAVHDRAADDARFVRALDLVVDGAADPRPYVRKAVNWALRQIGKRSERLRGHALEACDRVSSVGTPGARWIAADARRELRRAPLVARLRRRGHAASRPAGPQPRPRR